MTTEQIELSALVGLVVLSAAAWLLARRRASINSNSHNRADQLEKLMLSGDILKFELSYDMKSEHHTQHVYLRGQDWVWSFLMEDHSLVPRVNRGDVPEDLKKLFVGVNSEWQVDAIARHLAVLLDPDEDFAVVRGPILDNHRTIKITRIAERQEATA